MQVSQDDFESVVHHCSAQLDEHGLSVDEQLAAFGLDPAEIQDLTEAAWDGTAPDAPRAMRLGILIGVQLCREGLLGDEA